MIDFCDQTKRRFQHANYMANILACPASFRDKRQVDRVNVKRAADGFSVLRRQR